VPVAPNPPVASLAPGRRSNGDMIMRYLGYTLGDESVPISPPSPEMMAEMGSFVEEATKAGVLLATGGLGPSAEGTKVSYANGEFTVTDGPFAEAKELIGGWALMEVTGQERSDRVDQAVPERRRGGRVHDSTGLLMTADLVPLVPSELTILDQSGDGVV